MLMMTLHYVQWRPKNETIGAGVKNVLISVNLENYITKIVLAIKLRK